MKKILSVFFVVLVIFAGIFLVLNNKNLSVFMPWNNLAQVPAVPTVTFSASPMTVTTGDSTTLSWSSTDATSCSLDLGINGTLTVGPSGTQADTPIATKVYIIKCTGAGGSKNAKITVTVNPPSAGTPTVTLSASPSSITTGNSSTLSWSSTNATSCTAPWTTSTATSGTQSVSPTSTTTYTMTCANSAGTSASKNVTVTVTTGTTTPTPPTATPIPALIYPVPAGDVTPPSAVSNLRTWGVCDNMVGPTWDHATDNINVAGYVVEKSGVALTETIRTRPLNNTTTIRTWTTDTGLNPNTQYSYSVYAFDTSGNKGPKTTISATTTSGGCFYQMAPVPTNFKVTGTTSSSATLSWNPVTDPAYNVTQYRVYDYVDINNPTSQLIYTTSNTSYTDSGLQPNSTHTYYVSARNSSGKEGDWTTHITVTTPANTGPVVTLTASPSTINSGSASTLSWSSTNATSCTAPWTTSTATSGTQSVSPTSTTTYTMTCANSAGTSASKNVTVTVTTGGGGGGTPILPQAYVNTSMPNMSGGTIWNAANSCTGLSNCSTNLQTAINSAQPGDTVVIKAGDTFVGSFKLPAKNNPSNKWIVIQSSNVSSLPSPGKRVKPTDALNMPKLLSKNGLQVIDADPGASYYRLIGLEVSDDGTSSSSGPKLPGGGSGSFSQGYVGLGDDPAVFNTLAKIPHHIVIDRSYIHGTPTTNVKWGVHMDGSDLAVIDSYISEIHLDGQDSQAISGYNGPGPIKIVNNHLEGAGENIMFGGAHSSINGMITKDIEIRGNYVYKPTSWNTTSPNNDYAGIPWLVKNLFELKEGDRVLVEGNIFENNWADGQNGTAILIKAANQAPSARSPWIYTANLTFRNNIIKGSSRALNLCADCATPVAVGSSINWAFINNLWLDMDVTRWKGSLQPSGSYGFVQIITNSDYVTIENNTVFNVGGNLMSASAGRGTNDFFIFRDNIASYGPYGISNTVPTAIPGVDLQNNVIYDKALSPTTWPGNMSAANSGAVGFVNNNGSYISGDYSLSSSSPFKGKGTNGGDPGVDWPTLKAATQYALNGGGTPPPPPSSPSLTFTASPASIAAGASSTLTWSTSNVSGCTASNGWTGTKSTSGTLSVTPTTTTTYTLTCSGTSGGSVNRSVTVTVNSGTQIPTLSMTATPPSITSGQSSTITWSTTNATTCTASGGWSGTKVTSGTQSVTPTSTTTYSMVCTGAGGSATQSAVVTVGVPAPTPTVLLSASPTSIATGGSSTLNWSSVNATSCTASNGWTGTKATSGTQSVSPTATTTYTISCTGTGGNASQSVTVSVSANNTLPTISISAAPTTILVGASSTLSWSATNATSCTASNGWTGAKATSGTLVISPTSNSNYTLTCVGTGGSASQSVSVTVTPPVTNLPIISFNATPSSVSLGGSAILTWAVQNANSCKASGAWSGNQPTNGNIKLSNIQTSSVYTLACIGSAGSSAESVTIKVSTSGPGGGGGPTTPSNPGQVCAQVITWAKSSTGSIQQFSSPCNVPSGWTIVQGVGSGSSSLTPISSYKFLVAGATNTQIAILQDFLKNKGLFSLTQASTGFFGNMTFQAVQSYQRSKGLTPDGKVGPITLASINAEIGGTTIVPVTTPTTPVSGTLYRTLYRGMSGADVTYLQGLLKNLGYFQGSTSLFFGPITEASVKAFQVAKGLKPDGVVGPMSRAKILGN